MKLLVNAYKNKSPLAMANEIDCEINVYRQTSIHVLVDNDKVEYIKDIDENTYLAAVKISLVEDHYNWCVIDLPSNWPDVTIVGVEKKNIL